MARRLDRTPVVDGVYRLDAGAGLDECFPCLQACGGLALREPRRGAAMARVMGPVVPDVGLDGLKTLVGLERLHALPALWLSAAAVMRLVGCHAPQVRQGGCQRGRTTRQGERTPGPMGPETLANHLGQGHVRALAAVCNGVMRALATAGVLGTRVTGMAEGPALETTARDQGGGQATRQRRLADKRGQRHAIEGTVDGWNARRLIEAVTKRPLAVTVGPMQAPEARWTRALGTPARAQVAGEAGLDTVVCERGVWAGPDRWWLEPPGIRVVGPATEPRAVTADARALAAAGAGGTVGQRVPLVRHGPGRPASRERREPAGVGSTGRTTSEPSGPEAPGRHPHRRDFAPHPIQVVVVRPWPGRDDGPGGQTVFLPQASVPQPWPPVDDEDDRRLMAHGGSTEATQLWDVKHPPQPTARAGRVPVTCPLRLCALATAYRLPRAQDARGAEPGGWPRWRRQLQEHHRDTLSVCARGDDGLLPVAAYARLVGGKLKEGPPGIGTLPDILARSRLTAPE